ncbi:PhoX family protein [Brevibacterium litoralis]|uniref:PhoX family protein n=1 Tax=Brevibacterium litoralis TaxID=3138935 RepID=UPI0032EF120D
MADHVRGKRSPVTCQLKCGNACLGDVCNTSANPNFRSIASAALSRRAALGVGAAGALAVAVTTTGSPTAALAATQGPTGAAPAKSKLSFTPIDPVHYEVDGVHVPNGFTWAPIARWGDRLFPDSPEFDPESQTEAAQKRQFGYNCDYLSIQPVDGKNGKRALMFSNHEYVNEGIMYPDSLPAAERRAISRAAVGLTVAELTRKNVTDPWTIDVDGEKNRRFLMETEYAFTGPAAGSDLLKTADYPAGDMVQGTVGNCAGGLTPWGTLLSGEENFNGYFAAAGTTPEEQRYGLGGEGNGWAADDPRFDTRNPGYENEANRFGYIVEVDPWDPTSTPVKHTSLGRFKHEGANVIVAEDGRVVAYSGDDERFDYLYKFVSCDTYREGDRAHNKTLLADGDLFVAKFSGNSPESEIDGSGALPADGHFDGAGEWLPLVLDGQSAVEGMSVEEVLVHTRLAADKVGPTKMDRCEDVEPSLHTGRVYVACTNNTNRGVGSYAGVDEVNPRTQNRDGHVVEIVERDDQTSTAFDWNLLIVAGDPANDRETYFSGFPEQLVSPISCPDNLAFDSVGNLWISTDGQPSTIGYDDGLFKVTLDGPERGNVEQFLSVPRDGETCGPIIHDEERTVFVAVQHPGEDGSYASQRSAFPDFVTENSAGDAIVPRPSVVQVIKARRGLSEQDARQRALIGDREAGDSLRQGLPTA